jgi:cell division protein FtsL
VLEIAYTSLLVVIALIIAWFSVYVVYKLYQGQR